MKNLVLKPYERTRFDGVIEETSVDASMPLFPLIHKADSIRQPGKEGFVASDIFRSGRINPVPCDVFGEDLVYTFVGRPSYRELRFPVCFIIRPAPELLQNVFVFDTGAYYTNRYGKVVDNLLDINLFRISADPKSLRRFITYMFGNNENYYFSLPLHEDPSEIMNSEEEYAYLTLGKIMTFHKANFDTRCRTIENILRTPICLREYLQAIILPRSLEENDDFRLFCQKVENRPDILFYEDQQGELPQAQCHRLMDKVLLNYYLDKGYIVI